MVNQMRYCMLSFLMLSLTLNRRTEKVRNIWQLRIQNTNLLEVLAANPFGQNRHRKDVSESYSHCFRMSTFPHNKHITSSKTQCQLQNCSHCVEQSHLLSSDHNCVSAGNPSQAHKETAPGIPQWSSGVVLVTPPGTASTKTVCRGVPHWAKMACPLVLV